jgi:hypothetical protein
MGGGVGQGIGVEVGMAVWVGGGVLNGAHARSNSGKEANTDSRTSCLDIPSLPLMQAFVYIDGFSATTYPKLSHLPLST